MANVVRRMEADAVRREETPPDGGLPPSPAATADVGRAGAASARTATIATGTVLTAAVGVTALNGGGFNASSQSIFIALAGIALLAGVSLDGGAVVRAARSPLALTLTALAGLSVASAAWTVDGRAVALRWGLVIGGYSAVCLAASALARRTGPWPFAAAIAILAGVEAILGLDAVARHALPDAELIDGVWRPGGTLQYPPALAILQVGALPVLSALMTRRSRLIAGAAAAAAMLAGAVLGLAGSRLADALAVLLVVVLLLRPSSRQLVRMATVAVATFVVTGALLAPAVLREHAGQATAAGVSRRSHTGPARSRRSDVLHGRSHEWRAALETWLDHSLLGAGAGAYYTASVRHQGRAPTRYAHDLPLELAAELGVLGLLLGLMLYASTTWTVLRAFHTPALWLLAPTILAFLASNLLDWTWHLAGLGALWAAACGALNGAAAHERLSLQPRE